MRVNNINSSMNFTRAIEVRSNTNPDTMGGRIDNGTMNVISTIQNKPSIYDRETSRKIGNFFRAQLGDDSKNRVYTARIVNRVYIFTGEEAKLARQYTLDAKKEKEALDKKYAEGPKPDMPRSEQVELGDKKLYEIRKENIYLERDRKLLELVEDGGLNGNGENKPSSIIKLKISRNGRLKNAEFLSITEKLIKRDIKEKKLTL